MSKTFDRSADLIVDHPWVVTLLLAAVTSLAIIGYTDPELVTKLFSAKTDEQTSVSENQSDEYETPPDVDPVSISDSDAILVVESDSFFTQTGANALRRVVESLESLDYVKSILWMDRAPPLNIFGLSEPIFPRAQASPRRFEEARDKALAHPLILGQLLSPDGRTLILLIKFDWFYVEGDDDCTARLRDVAQTAAAEFPEIELSFLVSGHVPTYLAIVKTHENNSRKYQIIGYGMIALMTVILFRGISAVVIVAIAPSLGVFWTLGILRLFELQHNPFNDVVLPILLSLVGLTDGVHMMVQIRRFRASGLHQRDAAREGARQVGMACALTSLTTAIGFASLSLAHHETVREFGWSCVIGVFLTFIAVVTTIPLACSTWMGKRVHIGHEKGLIDRHLNRVGDLVEIVLSRMKFISLVGIGSTILFILIALTLRPDERRSNSLPTDSEAAIAMRHMDRAFGGLEFSAVKVRWTKAVASDSPEVLTAITEVDDLLRSEEILGHPLSIRNFVDALPGDGDPTERMSMLELLPPPLKRAFYTPEHRRASVNFRVQDLGIAKYGLAFERIEEGLVLISKRHPNMTFHLSGSAVGRWRNLYQIVVDLAFSLGTASIVIFFVLGVVYRSVRIGLISIVPNVFPLAVTGTALVIAGESLEIVSVCAFTVCLGIAVDDTIHFLTRYREEREKTDNEYDAVRRAFTGVGTALIMTTIVLVAGFSTVMFSGMRDQRIFASMGVLTISSALLADLVLLPALLVRFAKKSAPMQTANETDDSGSDAKMTGL